MDFGVGPEVDRGNEAWVRGEYELAAALYSVAVARGSDSDPALLEACSSRSAAYLQLGRVEAAVEDATRYIELKLQAAQRRDSAAGRGLPALRALLGPSAADGKARFARLLLLAALAALLLLVFGGDLDDFGRFDALRLGAFGAGGGGGVLARTRGNQLGAIMGGF